MKYNQLIPIYLSILLFSLGSFAQAKQNAGGAFFTVTSSGTPATLPLQLCLNGEGPFTCQRYVATGQTISVKVNLPRTYTAVGMKVLLPNYTIDGCTSTSNGFCVFGILAGKTKEVEATPSNTTAFTNAYIAGANAGDASIAHCKINPTSGSLTNCVSTDSSNLNSPSGLAFNKAKTLLYVTNPGTGTVSYCSLNASGDISSCNTATSGLSAPIGIALNPAGTIFYIVDKITTQVQACTIAGNNTLSCSDSGATLLQSPAGITLNSSGTKAYITNTNPSYNNTVQCNVSGTTLSGCQVAGSGNQTPYGLAFNSSLLYVVNSDSGPGGNNVEYCRINSSGNLEGCSNALSSGLIEPQFIAFNTNNVVYVTNGIGGVVTKCTVANNTFSNCSDNNVGIDSLAGIALS